MRQFAALFDAVDRTRSTNAKVAAMVAWFGAAPPEDAAWALWFLVGNRPKRLLGWRLLAEWTCELADVPGWLFDECYAAVGDLAEVNTLLLPEPTDPSDDVSLHTWMTERILPLRGLEPDPQKALVTGWWRSLPVRERFVLNKVITGGFRIGVSKTLAIKALAQHAELERDVVAHRLMGSWEPTADAFTALVAPDDGAADISRPYPFFLASPLEGEPADLGDLGDWQVEWKWDGIRAQIVRRQGQTFIWSRGEELVTERFPEIADAAAELPDGAVLDGEILAWGDAEPLPFGDLQTRINRKKLSKNLLAKVPCIFMAYDLLEQDGQDVRALPQSERRTRLEAVVQPTRLQLSEVVEAADWQALTALRETSRERGVEGFMLKSRDAAYGTGRKKGPWWKWKVDPYSMDAVLLYAHPGHGKRANLFTDYTFAVWRGPALVPVAKAYSGLTHAEIEELDKWIRRNTQERFGPVRQVDPIHVFELHFEHIRASTRHKSGVAVRFPRIHRWRRDKPPQEANTLEDLLQLVAR